MRLLYIYCSGANFDETPRHNTPMKLREKYTKLYDIEWNDAYDYFREKGWNEIETIVTLQRILRVGKILNLYPTLYMCLLNVFVNSFSKKHICFKEF